MSEKEMGLVPVEFDLKIEDSYLARAFDFLADGDFDRARGRFDEILDRDFKCAEAHLGLLLCDLGIRGLSLISILDEPFEDNGNYRRAVEYSSPALAQYLRSCAISAMERYEGKMAGQRAALEAAEAARAAEREAEIGAASADGAKARPRKAPTAAPKPGAPRPKAAKPVGGKPGAVSAIRDKLSALKDRLGKVGFVALLSFVAAVFLFLVTVVIMALIPPPNAPHGGNHSDLVMSDYGDYYEVSGYTGLPIEIIIPDTYNGKPVKSIGFGAFEDCTSLTSITIPNSVTSIGDYAFAYCTGLTSITIPGSVTSIGNAAFSCCTSLTSITIPSGVTSISADAFWGCSSLSSIAIPNSVTSIGSSAFSGCTGLTSITISDSVTSIGNAAFSGCTSLTSITIPGSVNSIGYEAFYGCASLTSATIPSSVESIGYYAFYGCTGLIIYCEASEKPSDWSLNWVSFGAPVEWGHTADKCIDEIYDGLCDKCGREIENNPADTPDDTPDDIPDDTPDDTPVVKPTVDFEYTIWDNKVEIKKYKGTDTAVTIPDTIEDLPVTTVGDSVFSGNTTLTSVVIPDSVTRIGYSPFLNCTALTSITIGSGVTSIGANAFSGCTAIESLYISDLMAWCNIDFSGDYSNPQMYTQASLYLDGELVTALIIPDGTTDIKQYAFKRWSELTSVFIPASVTSVAYGAFKGTEYPSFYCEAAEQPSGWSSLWNVNNHTVEWGHTADVCFDENDDGLCDKCKRGTFNKPANPASDFTYTISGEEVTITKYVGTATEVVIPSTIDGNPVTAIGDYVFEDRMAVTSVTIPDTVTSIGALAFSARLSLARIIVDENNTVYKSIDGNLYSKDGKTFIRYAVGKTDTEFAIPEGVTSIGKYAFHASDIANLFIPNSVTSIDTTAFMYTHGLTSIVVDEKNTAYKSVDGNLYTKDGETLIQYALGKTDSEFTIPTGVTGIGEWAFNNCASLISVTIPSGVTSIGRHAFSMCHNLTSINIPDSVNSIDESAFAECTGLTIYCEAAEKPEGWDASWNYSNCPVVWGHKE